MTVARRIASSKRGAPSGARALGRCCNLGRCRRALLRLLLRLGLLWVVALERFQNAGIRQETVNAIGGRRAFGEPRLRLLEIKLDAIGVLARKQGIVEANLLDEPAITRT